MTSGHGSDGKRFWINTRYGEKISGRAVAWDEIPKFAAAPKIFGAVNIATSLWILSTLFDGSTHDFAGYIYAPVIFAGLALAIALKVHEGGPVWRELAFGAGLLRLSSFVAHGMQWSAASRYDAVAVALVLVPLAWYLAWGIRRMVWEPFLSAVLLAIPVCAFAHDQHLLWQTVVVACLFGLLSTVLLAPALKFEYEKRERGMMQVD
jgi:hypothetical protein